MATNDNVVSFPSIARGGFSGRRLIPSRLRDGRIAMRLNQTELAEAVGVTRQAISSYELGEKNPEASTLAEIARVLEQPVAFFATEDQPTFGEFSAKFFRAFGAETKRRNLMCDVYAGWLVQVSKYIDDAINYPQVQLPRIEPAAADGSYSEEEIEEAAASCRKSWGLGYGPISNVLSLAESKGIIIAKSKLSGDKIEAFSFWNGSRPFIFLASDKDSAVRLRFDIAHEIGHLVLHRWVAIEDVEDPKVLRRIEAEANRFAGALLLPRQSFPNEVFTTRLDAFVELKKRWKVAIQAMVYRCKDLGIFDEYQITNLYKQISARKWRTKEPLDDPGIITIEEPKLLKKAVGMILESGRKIPDDISNDLALSSRTISILCNIDEALFEKDGVHTIQPTLK